MNQKMPLVSVPMLTYNHEKYIAQAIESVLKQKTDFLFELVIGEDCSTDGTRDIIESYGRQYPEQIKIVTSVTNVGALANNIRTTKACRGKYLAILEGDDYWNDEFKLQKQVDFLEQNPQFGIVHTDVNHWLEESGTLIENYNAIHHIQIPDGDIFEEFLDPEKYIIKTPTAVFRKKLFEQHVDYEVIRKKGWVIADLFTWLSMAKFAKVKYFPEVTATYRVLRESSSNNKDYQKKQKLHQSVFEIRLYFIEKYGCSLKIKDKVQKFYMVVMKMDSIKLKDRSMNEWARNYSKENYVSIGLKYKLLLLKTAFISYFKIK
jgi:glycosyltransferase involved in cell wall biosynthesis